jgi:TolB-like protein
MKRAVLGFVGLFLFIGGFFTGTVFAGQVVTKELSQWASQAIANEQALPVVLSSKSVAVLYFQNLTGNTSYNPLQKGLSVMLTTDLAKVQDLKVVERARLQAILEEIELGDTGLVDTETAPKIGRLVGARFLSGGDILEGSVTQLRVDPNLLDVSNQMAYNQAGAEGDLNDLIAIEKEILFEIIRLMDVALTPDQKADLEKPISTSIPALLLLFKGIDASDHGNYSQAADLYEQALTKDPNLSPAKEALSEIKTLELTSQSAETAQAEQAAVGAKKSGGLLKWTAVGLGVVAVGAGGYFVATALNDDDDDPEPEPPLEPGDTLRPTVTRTNPRTADYIDCASGSIDFHFSEAMNTLGGDISADDSNWAISSTEWTDGNRTLIMYWDNSDSDDVCDYPAMDNQPVTFILSGFMDVAGNLLDGETRFTYIRQVTYK